jgi:hypothetical protein
MAALNRLRFWGTAGEVNDIQPNTYEDPEESGRGGGDTGGYDPNILAKLKAGRGSSPTVRGTGPHMGQVIKDFQGGGGYDDFPTQGVVSVSGARFRAALGLDPLHDREDLGGGATADAEEIANAMFGTIVSAPERAGFDVGETSGDPDRVIGFDHRGMLAPATAAAGMHMSRDGGIGRGAAPPIATGAGAIPGAFDHLELNRG